MDLLRAASLERESAAAVVAKPDPKPVAQGASGRPPGSRVGWVPAAWSAGQLGHTGVVKVCKQINISTRHFCDNGPWLYRSGGIAKPPISAHESAIRTA